MPIIDMPVDMLLARIAQTEPEAQARGRGRGAKARRHEGTKAVPLGLGDLLEILPRLGCEIEEVADVQQYVCQVCGKIYDRTEAQGPPLLCSNCGGDFRATPDKLGNLGQNQVIRLNMVAVRPDIFDPGGMARFIRGYLEIQTGLAEYVVSAPRLRVQVDPQLANPDSFRPYVAYAVIRNVHLTSATIKLVMNLQEDLHWALGRDRKLASIGVFDLDTLQGDVFHYDAVDPDGLRFVPLGFDPKDPASNITPREILERHKTGQAYAHLLTPLKKYPLLRDGAGTVMALPPIINSESTRVTMGTRNFFIDVTGTSQRTVDRALNILVTSFKEIMPQIEIESVVAEGLQGNEATRQQGSKPADVAAPVPTSPRSHVPTSPRPRVRITPDLMPSEMTLSVRQAADTIGVELNAAELAELLESMGHGVEEGPNAGTLKVLVPPYRNDVMHPVDLIEDAAVAYGYENLRPELVPTFTVGSQRPIEEQSAAARRIMTGLGFHQVMTLVLTSEPAAFGKWRIEPDPRAVRIDNPISTEQTICRVSLLPGLLETLAINKQFDLPQHLFEVGDCSFVDPEAETGAREKRHVAAVMIGTHVGYADIRAVVDAFVREMSATCTVQPPPGDDPRFIPGRAAILLDAQGNRIGVMGEVHPEVLEAYGLKHPAVVMELSLEKLLNQ